jgi:molybdopterin converting factor subunit 1
MRVTVRLFGHFSDYGLDGSQIELPAGSTVATLAAELAQRDARFAPLGSHCRAAVNEEYASNDAPLADGDEVAFIPPMSGG